MNSLLIGLATVILYTFITTGAALQCLKCYSPELRYKWPITGLPYPEALSAADDTKVWNPRCDCAASGTDDVCGAQDSAATVQPSSLTGGVYEDCSTFCVSLIFKDPIALTNYYVRGCHEKLTGGVTNVSPSYKTVGSDSYLCQGGDFTAFSDAANRDLVYQQKALFCKTDTAKEKAKQFVPCNALGDPANKVTNCDATAYDSSVVKKCTTCMTDSSNCDGVAKDALDSDDYFNYCLKSDAKIAGKHEIIKSPSINPYGDARCVEFSYNLPTPTRRMLTYTAKKCYCDDDYCNGAPTVTLSLSFIPALMITLIKFVI